MTDETSNIKEKNPDIKEPKAFLMLQETIADPKGIIEEFFRGFHLLDALEMFWEICKGALASPHYDESSLKRSNLLFFAEQMTQFFAAVQQIYAPQAAGNQTPDSDLETSEESINRIHEFVELQKQMSQLLGIFSSMSLEEMEQDLDDWLKVALSTDNSTYADGKERGNLIALHGQLRTLVCSLHRFSKDAKPC